MSSLDEFGLPDTIFGRHDADFYGAVGRVACLAAVVEDQLRVLLQTLKHEDQSAFGSRPVGQIVKTLQAETKKPGWEVHERAMVADYLDRVTVALLNRNEILHSLWPAQGDGTWFRHRLDPGGVRVAVTTNLEEVCVLIAELANLVNAWQRIFSVVGVWSRAQAT